jgi:hypothetical protein
LDFQPLELWEINFCCFYTTQSMVFCYRKPKRLRHRVGPKDIPGQWPCLRLTQPPF